jgi:hypothetical protein
VTELAVVNMKTNGRLLALDALVCDAWVAWVELEPLVCQTPAKLAATEQARCTIVPQMKKKNLDA